MKLKNLNLVIRTNTQNGQRVLYCSCERPKSSVNPVCKSVCIISLGVLKVFLNLQPLQKINSLSFQFIKSGCLYLYSSTLCICKALKKRMKLWSCVSSTDVYPSPGHRNTITAVCNHTPRHTQWRGCVSEHLSARLNELWTEVTEAWLDFSYCWSWLQLLVPLACGSHTTTEQL